MPRVRPWSNARRNSPGHNLRQLARRPSPPPPDRRRSPRRHARRRWCATRRRCSSSMARAPAAGKKLCSLQCALPIRHQRLRDLDRLFVQEPPNFVRWQVGDRNPSGISALRAVWYPVPSLSTTPVHRFRNAARASDASLASRLASGCDASSSPNFTAVTRSAWSSVCASTSSPNSPARTSNDVAFLNQRISHHRAVSTIWRAVCMSRAASIAGRWELLMSAQSTP